MVSHRVLMTLPPSQISMGRFPGSGGAINTRVIAMVSEMRQPDDMKRVLDNPEFPKPPVHFRTKYTSNRCFATAW